MGIVVMEDQPMCQVDRPVEGPSPLAEKTIHLGKPPLPFLMSIHCT